MAGINAKCNENQPSGSKVITGDRHGHNGYKYMR
jgi:hypothetical protein